MRRTVWATLVCSLLLAGTLCASSGEPTTTLGLRIVQLPGELERADLETHLAYLNALGFNAFWVHAAQISLTPLAPAATPSAGFTRLTDWCRRHDARVIVSINPARADAREHALVDRELVRDLRRFARGIARQTGPFDLVLSFEDSSAELNELRDILQYGRFSAPAHVDLSRRVRAKLPRGITLWMVPAPPARNRRGDLVGPESTALLPPSVGIVWPGVRSPAQTVTSVELDELLARTGQRPVLLRDRFPANQAGNRMPISHNLGPLRGREASLARRLAGHASVAMADWGASRLTLSTVADWHAAPDSYDADASWQRAIAKLAGEDEKALDALRTQALEWGGPPGDRNHHTAENDNPTSSVAILRDPALVARWRWTLTRYPERMEQLRGLADHAFRDELLETMARRLAIARAIPPLREILARQAAGRSDLAGLIEELQRLKNRTSPSSAQAALDRFLNAAGVGPLLRAIEESESARD